MANPARRLEDPTGGDPSLQVSTTAVTVIVDAATPEDLSESFLAQLPRRRVQVVRDRKSTRLNSSH